MPAGEDLAELGRAGGTLVLHLAVQRIDAVVAELAASTAPTARSRWWPGPAARTRSCCAARWPTCPAQVREAGIRMAAVVIVGPALAAAHFPDSHLYSDARCRN